MEYKIVIDSAGDLRTLEDIPFASVPLKILAGEKEYVDDEALDAVAMAEELKHHKGKSGTACPSVGEYLEAFGEAEQVFCVTIPSGLSGSCNAAKIAAETYREQHPERKVYVLDSLSAGPEMALLAQKLRAYILEGKLFEEIVERIEEYRQKTHLIFSLESLTNLANNGRVNPAVAKIAGILGIRMVGKASDQGTLEILDKARGEKRALADIWKDMLSLGYNGGRVLIDHCNNLPAAQKLSQMIREKFAEADVTIGKCGGLCTFYAELGGLMVGFEG